MDQFDSDKIAEQLSAELLLEEWILKGRTGETTFFFTRFGAVQGDDILDKIREQAGLIQLSGNVDFAMVITKLPRIFIKQLQAEMFGSVYFRNRIRDTRTILKANEVDAFDAMGAKALDIKHVLVRALAVNFMDSALEIKELISWVESLGST